MPAETQFTNKNILKRKSNYITFAHQLYASAKFRKKKKVHPSSMLRFHSSQRNKIIIIWSLTSFKTKVNITPDKQHPMTYYIVPLSI